MSKEVSEKTVSFVWQGVKVTKDILKELCQRFLENKQSHGVKTYGELANHGKLESIEITENNIGDFLNTARKYDIDFALKRDTSSSPPIYHIFFSSGNSENFRRAFHEYVVGMQEKFSEKSVSQIINREQIKHNAKIISQKSAEKSSEKHLSKTDIAGR